MTIYTLEPSTTVIWRDRTPDGKAKILATPCDCPDQIPGLTSDFCKIHRTYWVDRFLELEIRLNKKAMGSSFDVNEGETSKQRSTSVSSCATSAEIWGQEDGSGGDRVNHTLQQSEPTLEAEETGELIRVVNVKAIAGKLPNLIVAMKSKGHPLGNPFYREAKSDRAGCIRKFKKWLWEQYQIEGSAVRAEIEAIADLVMAGEQVNLGCVCKQPDKFVSCHCDEIKALVEWLISQRLEVAA